jgi:hypothetical protein
MTRLLSVLLGAVAVLAGSVPAEAQSNDLRWIPAPKDGFDKRALSIGTMADGLPVFVCHARYNNGIHPGMVAVFTEGCLISYGGRAISVKAHSILVGKGGRWVKASGGNVPANAIEGGNEADDNLLFVCRARVTGGVVSGKVRQGFRGCNFADQGKEVTATAYEVLVR